MQATCQAVFRVPTASAPYPQGMRAQQGVSTLTRDKQPQVPAAPKLGGFYQRDARDVEAQLLAQAYAARTGQPAASQPAPSQAPDISNLPQESAYGRSIAQPGVNVGIGGASSKGSRAQSASCVQHSAAWRSRGESHGAAAHCGRPLGSGQAIARQCCCAARAARSAARQPARLWAAPAAPACPVAHPA